MRKNNTVLIVTMLLSLIIAFFAIVFSEQFASMSNYLFSLMTENMAWLFLSVMIFYVAFVIVLSFTKYGKIRLGKDDERPEYSTFSWFAMLFCAGMGVGLVFWGISEPISHFINPISGIESGTPEAAEFAIKASFMHWGIHPWANYAIVGLVLAYFMYRKSKPGTFSYVIEPLTDRSWVGTLVDCLAAFATVAGIVTSLGLGVLQISSGLNQMFNFPNTVLFQIVIIAAVTAIFMWSAISGIDQGVKKLSNLNVYIAIALMIGTIIIGPKLEMVNNLVSGIGAYLGDFIEDSLGISSYGDASWIKAWRVFYWAWWIAWAPFVGVFIARISKGRTIREFVAGVVLAPTLASLLWFAIFGTMGIHVGINGKLPEDVLQGIASRPESGLFIVFEQFPFGKALSVIALLLLLIFFITSADSGTFVLSMLSSHGSLNPPTYKKVIWGIMQSLLAIGLLLSGGLKPLQTFSIIAAFPFMFVMIAMCVSLVKELRKEQPDENG